ncbi:STAS domain-containing protein (plasmid) [Cupriavidus sp. KK10]|jgi:MFS superfamily sulfate permease-like transporter|uniref:SulP family inorganic anion transporter n=1 Tax=Cupriavidus sp. KK10 TaxID=1478019 RepID=UPI001BAD322A|nr:SulP family inorganic anion transporter [Cupriavidus sp. KK10]QUN31991.1 STAS domain-containing protein [Cupriavidus sp. KK10]
MIVGYMSSGQAFDDAIGEFATEYSSQNRSDYARSSAQSGRGGPRWRPRSRLERESVPRCHGRRSNPSEIYMLHESTQPVADGPHLAAPDWLRAYRKAWLKPDVIAGLTVAAVVIPKALAYATVAGLPIQVGHGNLGALLTATATLTLLVGVILVLASLLRLGFVGNFISDPVLTGFKAGIAIVIVVDQLPKLLAIHFTKGSFGHNLLAIGAGLPHTSLTTLCVGLLTVGMQVAMEHFWPKAPAPLIAVAAGIAGVSLLGQGSHGVEVVGHVPTGLPALTMPDLSMVRALWPAAVGIALMSFTETIAAGRAFVQNDESMPAANRELFATGLANLGGAFLGAMPGGGGTTQTAVNRLAGARTQVAALVTAAATLCTMLLLAPYIGKMPHATLAAVVIVYSVGLINPAEFQAILAVRRTEFLWALTAMVGVVLLGTLQGIVVAIAVSLLALAHQVSNPPLLVLGRKQGTGLFRPASPEHPDDERFPGLLLLRPEGRIFFANAERLAHQIASLVAEANPSVVVLDLRAVFDLEYTALKMLTAAEKKSRENGRELWLVGLTPGVLAIVQRSPLGEALGPERVFPRLEDAVACYQACRKPKA